MDWTDSIKVPNFLGSKVRKNCILITAETMTKNSVNTMAAPSFFPVPKIFSQNSCKLGIAPTSRIILITLKKAKKAAFSEIKSGKAKTVLPTANINSVNCILRRRKGRKPIHEILRRTSKSKSMVNPNCGYLLQGNFKAACTIASTTTKKIIVYLK